jgi:predicted RecA/RadA family phage recombinase
LFSGQVVIAGSIAGVAAYTAGPGAQAELSVRGVFDIAKTPADGLTVGLLQRSILHRALRA